MSTKHVREIIRIGESLGLSLVGQEQSKHVKLLFATQDGKEIRFPVSAGAKSASCDPRLLKNAKSQLRRLMNGEQPWAD